LLAATGLRRTWCFTWRRQKATTRMPFGGKLPTAAPWRTSRPRSFAKRRTATRHSSTAIETPSSECSVASMIFAASRASRRHRTYVEQAEDLATHRHQIRSPRPKLSFRLRSRSHHDRMGANEPLPRRLAKSVTAPPRRETPHGSRSWTRPRLRIAIRLPNIAPKRRPASSPWLDLPIRVTDVSDR
jgi:hypothetical protein